ncbi:Histidine ammonia-lyase [Varanus komodoensis]|nr:Histidine ammonia-lyase [Varanus komodoensis]
MAQCDPMSLMDKQGLEPALPASRSNILTTPPHWLTALLDQTLAPSCPTSISENKALCYPSSVDSLSTSAATEDHVSMGGWAARKALKVIEHVEQVLAIELLAACQGIEFLRPLRTTTPLEKVYDLVRSVVRPWMKDRFMAPDVEAAHRLLVDQKASAGTGS